MRRLIDGHAHIVTPHRLPWTDALTQATRLPYGRLRAPDGSVRSFLPPCFADSCFPVESLIAVMDQYQVEKAAVMAHLEGDVCETACDALQRYPDRLSTAISLEPKAESIEKLHYWFHKGIRILKFEMRGMYEMYPGLTVADPGILAMIGAAERLGMVVVIDPSPVSFPSYRPDCMRTVIEKHPNLRLVVCHMGLPYPGMKQNAEHYRKWREMIALCDNPNVYLDLAAIPDLFVEENFPYAGAMELLHEVYDRYGAGRFIWGSDIPGTFMTATYVQMVQAFERLPFLTEADKDKMFYKNADGLYFA